MARARHLRLTALLLLLEVVRAGDAVLESEVGVEEVEETFSTVLLGGNKTDPRVETLSRRSFCSHGIKPFPGIRFAASGCYLPLPAPSVLVCGGRENLFSLSSSCWRYSLDKESWVEEERLPLAVAGAATVCTGERMMMIGGVVEEDYYQDQSEDPADTGDHYDYSTEVATGQVLEYEAGLDKWELGPGVPETLQGACGVSAGDRVILTGGKNDKECSYGSQSVWVLDGGEWMRGPDMSHARFHHGCAMTEVGERPGVMVLGGLGPQNLGDSVEFLPLEASDWVILHKLENPRPNLPILSRLGDSLAVIGGGGWPYPGGEGRAEILTSEGWRSFRHVGLDRSFGLGIQVPDSVTRRCEMEPNFGGHSYFRRQGEAMLRDRVWLCHGERLELPLASEEDRLEVTGLMRSCTVPSCHYTELPRELLTTAVTGLECGLVSGDRVECQVSCAPGHQPLGGVSTSSCTRDTRTWDVRYLECQSIVN